MASPADTETFSLERFEYLAYNRDREQAAREFLKLLRSLDQNFGSFDIAAKLYAANAEAEQHQLLARVTAALSCLFSDPEFNLSPEGWEQMISWQRWIAALFAASGFGNADHVLRAMNVAKSGTDIEVTPAGLVKFCMLFTPDSEIPLNLDGLWRINPRLAASLFFVLLSPRFLGTTAAHDKREVLLGWLPAKLDELDTLDQLPTGILHDVYMHCSYADLATKHEIKKPLNRLFRRTMRDYGITDIELAPRPKKNRKQRPILLVVLEYFSVAHSIYRTHSTTLRAARDRFHIIGMGTPQYVDQVGREVFHEFVELGGDLMTMLRQIRQLADERAVSALYMPSVGMFPLTMFLANLRVAPLQLMALGHPATTHSDAMDYVVVEEDYVGDPACFSETLLQLPKDGLPYVPSAAAATEIVPVLRENPEVVRIAICATTMKLNPKFLWSLANIVRNAKARIEFHMLIGFSQGITAIQVKKILQNYLGPYAHVYAHQPYTQYMEIVRHCDLFLNPFPFGNTNGIVDTVSAGLVGICRTGAEVHEHIDEGLFRRLGLPEWTITKTTEEYVAAAVRLIDDHGERLALRRALLARNGVKTLFEGRPEIFGERLLTLVGRAQAMPRD